jgi:hypothetical protein
LPAFQFSQWSNTMQATSAAIYADGGLYSGGAGVIDDLKASGFTSVIAWALHVQANGDLSFNDEAIVTGGSYSGTQAWPGLLVGLKQGTTSVSRLSFSVGGWGVGDFPNIKALLAQGGGKPGGALYESFAALKQAIPDIDAIDLDDETLYDPATTVGFCQMLAGLGYQITFCPYGNSTFWTGCLQQLEASNPGLVTAFNLQCYAGGGGNDPADWISAISTAMGSSFPAASFVIPGLWCSNGPGCTSGQCPDSIQSSFAQYRPDGVGGGFIWVLGDIQKCATSGACGTGAPMGTAAYAAAVLSGLGA